MNKKPAHLSLQRIAEHLSLTRLIDHLETAMKEPYVLPVRSRVERSDGREMLIMPVASQCYTGAKTLNIIPDNPKRGLPAIDGLFTLFDGDTGQPLASLEASELTGRRTAALSALASRYLSRRDARTLLILGTGHLAPFMAEAHANVRPIEHVQVWGRDAVKAQDCAERIAKRLLCKVEPIRPDELETAVRNADIVSAATRSREPLILGDWLSLGTHVDLVGSYRPDMREVDATALRRSRVFVDTLKGVLAEAGDILVPVKQGEFSTDEIVGDIKTILEARDTREPDDITLFKSVGSAACDLAAAACAYESFVTATNG